MTDDRKDGGLRRLATDVVSLLANTGIQSGFGFVFAVIAAHRFDAGTVGRDLTIMSVGRALSGLTQLNTNALLYRTMAVIDRPARLLVRVYAWTGAFAVVASAATLLIGSRYSGSLEDVVDRPVVAVGFVAFVALWNVYALQDAALVALRRANVTPFESLAFGLLTVGGLVTLHVAEADFPVFWAFVAPLPILVVVINVLLFARYIDQDLQRDPLRRPLVLRHEARVLSVDVYLSTVGELERGLLPLLVAQRLDNEAAAYFAAAYAISAAIRVGVSSIAVPFGVELAREPHRRQHLIANGLSWIVRYCVPVCVLVAAASPVILSVFGPDYRRAALWLLVLFTLSAAPGAVLNLAVNVARVDRSGGVILWLATQHAVLVLVVTAVFLESHGLVTIGIAYAVSESAGLLVSLWYLRRPGPRSSLAT